MPETVTTVSVGNRHYLYISEGSAQTAQHQTPEAAALPKLVWTKPVVRELFGEEKRVRLAEVG